MRQCAASSRSASFHPLGARRGQKKFEVLGVRLASFARSRSAMPSASRPPAAVGAASQERTDSKTRVAAERADSKTRVQAMLAAPAPDASVTSLIVQKRKAKADMQAWELIYEEQNDGLVPTHHDKKASATYCELKAKALTIEASLKLCRAEAKAGRAAEDDADRQAARAEGEQRRAARSNGSKNGDDLGHRGEEMHDDMQGVGGMENLFEEHVSVSPWQVATMAVATVVPTILFCGLFSFMGFGSLNFAVLKCFVNFYRSTASFAVMVLLLPP